MHVILVADLTQIRFEVTSENHFLVTKLNLYSFKTFQSFFELENVFHFFPDQRMIYYVLIGQVVFFSKFLSLVLLCNCLFHLI